ncbi:MAG: hypothetical protein AAGK05_16200, partial [Pseudomonadota bacterium]
LPSRRTFARNIMKDAQRMEKRLTIKLATIKHLAVRADAWSAHNRSFLGLTIHWIDRPTLRREKGVLACVSVTEAQTYELLNTTLQDVFIKYNIHSKVVSVTTDNGRNFVKCFQVFGENSEDGVLAHEEADSDDEVNLEDEDDATPLEISDLMESRHDEQNEAELESGELTQLPPHRRCVAHTLNLIATTDLNRVPGWTCAPKPIFIKVKNKAIALWNRQNRCTQVAAVIRKEIGKLFCTPVVTRWNSLYDAMKDLGDALESKLHKINKICLEQKISCFNNVDKDIIVEYVTVMTPIAQALDYLQSEKAAYMGVMLPSLYCIQQKIGKMQASGTLKYCSSLTEYILDSPLSSETRPKGFKGRFAKLFNNRNLLAATATHPCYK